MTMSTIKKGKKNDPLRTGSKASNQCLRKRLAWCNQSNVMYDSSEEQYSILPRAISDGDGNPHKANKSN